MNVFSVRAVLATAIGLAAVGLIGVTTAALAQQGQGSPDDNPLTSPSVPLTYVGGSGRVSIGFDQDGNNQGDALGVFASNGERAVVAQLWWKSGGAGGLQMDYNWLWGSTAEQLREHPEQVLVAKASFALDQSEDRDRKATIAFGLERNDYFLNSYLSAAASGGRSAGALIDQQVSTLTGTDAVGSYNQLQTVEFSTPLQTQPYRGGAGFRLGRYYDALTMRATAGMDYEFGNQGAHETRLSVALDKYLGKRGWSAAAQAEHSEVRDAFGQSSSDDRVMLYLRYEFGGQGAFVARDQLSGPAWVSRALRTPTSGHSREVKVYTSRKGPTTSTTSVGPRQYTNRSPLVVGDSLTVSADSSGTLIDVLANDSDPDGQPLQITGVTAPAHGTAQIVGNQIRYTPTPGYIGADSFGYTVSDPGGLSASGSVSVTVQSSTPNRPPVARDDSASTLPNTPLTINVLGNDSDPDGDPLTITSVTPASPDGSTQITANGQILFTPAPGFNGTARFGYTISDGRGGSASAQVTISVTAVTRPPVAIDDSAFTMPAVAVVINVLANDSDPDGDALSVVSVSIPASGIAIQNADNTITYTPYPSSGGTQNFDYTISDGRGGTASATVTVTVSAGPPTNTPPVANDDTAVANTGAPITINVLANDTDADGDVLVVTSVSAAQFGNAVINSGGTITYSAPASFTGTDRFDYSISDGHGGTDSATVTVAVSGPPANTPPVANNDNFAVTAGTPITLNVLANDTDADGDVLAVTAVTPALVGVVTLIGNGSITYLAPPGYNGPDRFDYTISDGRGGIATATVLLAVSAALPNNPPIANNDSVAAPVGVPFVINVLANDTDPDGDPLTLINVSAALIGNATPNSDGTVTYFAPAGSTGVDQFGYTISDGRGGTASAQVTVGLLGAD